MVRAVWRDESNRGERLRRIAMAAGWQLWKHSVRRPLDATLFNGMRFRAYPDCTVSSAAFYTRIPNHRHIEYFRRQISGGTLVDVGANVGLVSMLLADKIQHALLFEPNPAAVRRARESIALNRLRYEVHELALSDQSGEVEFEDTGGASPTNRTVVGFTSNGPTIRVRRVPLDDFLLERKLPAPITAVKIDVEGHENAVLRGMQGVLRNQRPRIVMFEYLERTDLRETREVFSACGYRILVLTNDGRAQFADGYVEPLQDLFACPEEMTQEVVRS